MTAELISYISGLGVHYRMRWAFGKFKYSMMRTHCALEAECQDWVVLVTFIGKNSLPLRQPPPMGWRVCSYDISEEALHKSEMVAKVLLAIIVCK